VEQSGTVRRLREEIKLRTYHQEEDMKRIPIAICIMLVFLISACGLAPAAAPAPTDHFASQRASGMPALEAPANSGGTMGYSDASGNGPVAVAQSESAAGQDRLVIQNAELSLVVKDPAAKMQAISGMATTMEGFVVSSNMAQTLAPDGTKVPEGTILVRVPAAKLDEALKQIKADALDVESENRSGQDVTKEYTDLQSQLTNLEDTEAQLTLIMQKADKTDDVLAIFNQLTQIRGQIDVIKGQMQYYKQSAALSAITVQLVAQQSVQPIQIAGWQPQGDARNAVQALANFAQAFVTFLIWLALFALPAGLLVLLPFYLIFLAIRAVVRSRRGKKEVTTEK
jgi:hypothetical protein